MEKPEQQTESTYFLDYQNPIFDEFLQGLNLNLPERDLAVVLYNKVRDHFLYDPHHLDLRKDKLKASTVLTKNRAWCVEKSLVLCALLRKTGIPSRLSFGIVKNHIGVEKLQKYLRRDEIVFHGFVKIFLADKWISCTPAFDQRICRFTGVDVLDFDGMNDSLFQPYSGDKKFMEYLHYYGDFDDLPHELMIAEMKSHYPHLFEKTYNAKEFSFLYD
ncbi:MAG: hypothetical protein ACI9XP_000052 [Lentimonas sp.]|jgi:hypothetical protein